MISNAAKILLYSNNILAISIQFLDISTKSFFPSTIVIFKIFQSTSSNKIVKS